MPAIRDRQLARVYDQLERDYASDPATKVDDSNLLQILAAIGDTRSKSETKIRSELVAAGNKPAQLALVKKGLSQTEKKDLGRILDQGKVPLTPAAKNFLEAVVDRAVLDSGSGPLQIVKTTAQGFEGTAAPGVSIEAINLTTAPSGRLHTDDTVVIGTADSTGKFTGQFTGQLRGTEEGDVVRLRTRDAQGKTSDWLTVQVSGLAQRDTRNAQLALFRIGLTATANGKVSVENINASRQISEPDALVQFTNLTSGEKTLVTLGYEGTFPAGLELKGVGGDKFDVSVSDGKNNVDFKKSEGILTVPVPDSGGAGGVDLPDPALHRDELNPDGTPKFQKTRFTGPLFEDNVSPADVVQGQLGDCYFPSAMAALAQADPSIIRDMVVQNADLTYTVTFKKRNWRSGKTTDVRVKVDGDLYVRSYGGPLYGSGSNSTHPAKMELWFSIVEKAYAAWIGSYDKIGNGGYSEQVFEDCTGREGYSTTITESRTNAIWKEIKNAVDDHRPASMGTYDEAEAARYHNSGVHADHSYSVLSYKVENGQRLVQLRNPWGQSEPGDDGENDGIFWMKIEDVCHLYSNFSSVR